MYAGAGAGGFSDKDRGEHRISNFLLWQIAYAEFWFTDVLWPDFDEHVFEGALNAFFCGSDAMAALAAPEQPG